jgi:PKD repeat protein
MLANNTPALKYPVASDSRGNAPIGLFALQYAAGQPIRFDEYLSRAPNPPPKTSGTWRWIFGDGGVSAAITPSHTYKKPGTYDVHAQIYDATLHSWTDIDSARVEVIAAALPQPPVAQVKASATTTAIGDSVSFDATGSHAELGSALTYLWNFNDGLTATGPQVTHKFAAPGKGFVALIVTDERGARSVATSPIVIVQALPTARLKASATDVEVGESITLDASASVAPPLQGGNSISRYIWIFGDGTPPLTTNSLRVTKTYAREGVYTITLEVLDKANALGATTLSVTVRPSASSSGSLWIAGALALGALVVAIVVGWPRLRRLEQWRRIWHAAQAYLQGRAQRKGK